MRVEIYDRAMEKLAGPFALAGVGDGERGGDELALAVGRAWLSGYRAGRADARRAEEGG
ncbi:MAG: hypothetical protein M3P49_07780 [Actinomycetota bacterium]|nr:hypothetical protein [Actinomycetota bacterium]